MNKKLNDEINIRLHEALFKAVKEIEKVHELKISVELGWEYADNKKIKGLDPFSAM